MKRIIPIIFLSLLISCTSEIKQPPGVFAADPPKQSPLKQSQVWEKDGYFINAIAQFELKAKVLGKERYRFDRVSDFAPYDLALGWGRMSDESVLESIRISQGNRWYFWETDHFPIPRREIETHSGNMHIIPENDDVYE